jgi:hypothetical protein
MTSAVVPRDAPRLGDHAVSRAARRRGETLRGRLQADPNDVRSFTSLVALLVRLKADRQLGRPLAPVTTDEKAAAEATWALAVELARHPRAWYPLIELARLSLHQDSEAAVRRLASAADRDPTGQALTSAAALLRAAGHPDEAFRLTLARWRPHDHGLGTGRQLVLAGLEAGRTAELSRHLDALSACPGGAAARMLRTELARYSTTGKGAFPAPTSRTRTSAVLSVLPKFARIGRLHRTAGPRR